MTDAADAVHAEKLHRLREAMGVFQDLGALEAAAEELESAGFDQSLLSLLAEEEVMNSLADDSREGIETLEDNPTVGRIGFRTLPELGDAEGVLMGLPLYVGACIGIGTAITASGSLTETIIAAVVGGGLGGAAGAIFARRLDLRYRRYLKRQINKGGVLLWVRMLNDIQENRACEILRRHGARDVHIHEFKS
jgi:hypothetical protein